MTALFAVGIVVVPFVLPLLSSAGGGVRLSSVDTDFAGSVFWSIPAPDLL